MLTTPNTHQSSSPATSAMRHGQASPAPDTATILIPFDGSAQARRRIQAAAPLIAGRRALILTLWRSIKPVAGIGRAALPKSVVVLGAHRADEEARAAAEELALDGAALAREHGIDAMPLTRLNTSGSTAAAIAAAAAEHGVAVVVVGGPSLARRLTRLARRRPDGRTPGIVAAL